MTNKETFDLSPYGVNRHESAKTSDMDGFLHPGQTMHLNKDLSLAMEQLSILSDESESEALQPQSRFVPEQLLGSGAYGEVWRVHDHFVERPVAVKKMIEKDGRIFSDMQKEASLGARVAHCGTPTVYDIGVDEEGRFRVIMEYLEGESLDKVIERLKAGDPQTHEEFPFSVRANILLQILRVLVSAHGKNIVHCDIKPANVMIGLSKETYLCDWGIALDLKKGSRNRILGTPSFMAPEQIHLNSLDNRADIFGFSALAYSLFSLTSWHPYSADIKSYLHEKLSYEPKDIDHITQPLQGHVPSEYRDWIHKGLNLDPESRYQTATEMLNDLNRIQQGVFCATCPRTYIKSWGFRYFRALDNNPSLTITLSVIMISLSALFFIAFGTFLG